MKKETTSRRSRAFLIESALLAILGLQPASALQEAVGHVEISPAYNTSTSSWSWKTHWFDNDLNEREDAVGTLFFPGWDTAPNSLGVRNNRPADPKWDFLGVGAGEPVWIFTGTSHVSAGFAASQTGLTGDMVFKLDGVTGPAGGVFSMYAGTTPTIYMQTIDGVSAADEFRKPLNHTHVNWAFSRKGLWIVRLKVQGTLTSGNTSTATSPAQPIVFAIGGYARWKAATFTQAELTNPAISGDHADPDHDGVDNLTEYALGGNPRVSSSLRTADQQALAPRLLPPTTVGGPWTFTFFRRTPGDEPDITYKVEASASLAGGSWTTETGSIQILSSGSQWQQVAVPLGSSPATSFFRLKVETTD